MFTIFSSCLTELGRPSLSQRRDDLLYAQILVKLWRAGPQRLLQPTPPHPLTAARWPAGQQKAGTRLAGQLTARMSPPVHLQPEIHLSHRTVCFHLDYIHKLYLECLYENKVAAGKIKSFELFLKIIAWTKLFINVMNVIYEYVNVSFAKLQKIVSKQISF